MIDVGVSVAAVKPRSAKYKPSAPAFAAAAFRESKLVICKEVPGINIKPGTA